MKICKFILVLLGTCLFAQLSSAEQLQRFELENGSLLAGYSSYITSPFMGAAAYANGDGVEADAQISGVPGVFRLDVRGASDNNTTAGISVYLDSRRLGELGFSGTTPSVQSLQFNLEEYPGSNNLRFVRETDDGSNNVFLDWFELHRLGDIPPPPPPPVLPTQGAYESGVYRNMFAEFGYSQAEVDARVQEVYDQLFHSPDRENEAIFIPVGSDMAYIWDVGNNDVRSEGMSYGMMAAVQMGRKDDFDRLWKWAHTYSLNKDGDMKGYFAWQVTTDGQVRDRNPAPDGEAYFATALFFASHLWGDGEGIFNYREQANNILDDMYSNGQTRYNNQGQLETFSLFDHDTRLIVFSPATPTDRNWTDPSYHLPAYFDLWAMWADNNNQFWAEAAEASRQFLHTTVHPVTGLNPDYAHFDGSPHGDFQHWKDTFQYDAWRTVSNAAIDYAWFQKDPWQVTYAETLQAFFDSEGIGGYSSLYELDGTPYEGNSDHSPGLVAMNAVASLASEDPRAWKFVQALWDTPVPTGQWRYYDGALYMFAMLRLSGNYRIICPAGECDTAPPPTCEQMGTCPDDAAPVAVDDAASVVSGDTVSVEVLQNDFHPDGLSFSLVSHTQGGNGSVSRSGSVLSYTPNAGFVGTDSFSYTISDGTRSDSAQVTVTVQSADNGNGNGNGAPEPGSLVGQFEFENATSYFPSYRGPMQHPYPGATIHDNGEGVSFTLDTLPAGSYSMVINGSSTNHTEAGVSVYVGGVQVGATSFTGTSRQEKTIEFTLGSSASEIVFTVETNTGQNDTRLDWFRLYSGSSESGGGENGNGNGNGNGEAGVCESVLIQAEDYTDYFDTTSGNAGGSYRHDDVDIQITSDVGGGYNVGWTAAGEWLEYPVNLPGGDYRVDFRVASNPGGGLFTLSANGNEVIAPIAVNQTGGWQNWITLSAPGVYLPPGAGTLRFDILSGDFNINWLRLVPEQCGGAASEVVIQAQDYVDYYDTTSGNQGGAYRNDDVDIEVAQDVSGDYNVGWTEAGEWLEYSATFEEGVYRVESRVATALNQAAFNIQLNGSTLLPTHNVSSTGGWQSWQTLDHSSVHIPAGSHTIRVNIVGSYLNLNWIRFVPE